jgi:orotate phosphoribosyltransferase
MSKDQSLDNLWLARVLHDLGAVRFGDFTLGESTVNSPVYINPKVLISNPTALRVAAKLMVQEVELAQSRRRSQVQRYDIVAGVPVGGLLLAMAYSMESVVPLIYPRMQVEGTGHPGVEGRFIPGMRALLIDDLITGGSSVVKTANFLKQHDIEVVDVVVLIDRQMGARSRLKHMGMHLTSILSLDVMMNLYHNEGLISDAEFDRYVAYAAANQRASADDSFPNPSSGDA